MAIIGTTIVILGEVTASEPLVLEGQVQGRVTVPEHELTVAESGRLKADVLAHSLTLHGKASGNLAALEWADVHPTANVSGKLTAPIVKLVEGATFNGRIETKSPAAAVSVAQYRTKERSA
jgi:cytoskeletal protein CcmA (bactofilin family)